MENEAVTTLDDSVFDSFTDSEDNIQDSEISEYDSIDSSGESDDNSVIDAITSSDSSFSSFDSSAVTTSVYADSGVNYAEGIYYNTLNILQFGFLVFAVIIVYLFGRFIYKLIT